METRSVVYFEGHINVTYPEGIDHKRIAEAFAEKVRALPPLEGRADLFGSFTASVGNFRIGKTVETKLAESASESAGNAPTSDAAPERGETTQKAATLPDAATPPADEGEKASTEETTGQKPETMQFAIGQEYLNVHFATVHKIENVTVSAVARFLHLSGINGNFEECKFEEGAFAIAVSKGMWVRLDDRTEMERLALINAATVAQNYREREAKPKRGKAAKPPVFEGCPFKIGEVLAYYPDANDLTAYEPFRIVEIVDDRLALANTITGEAQEIPWHDAFNSRAWKLAPVEGGEG